MIDLRSDTVTQPSKAMREAMAQAQVGDDVFIEDPTVNSLEERLASAFGMDAGIFCSSGTMANQIAIKVHTSPGDQVICSWAAHIYNYEGGGMAMNSGVTAKLLEGKRGLFTAAQVEAAILPDDVHCPVSRLVAIEDTSNKGGGAIWPLSEISAIRQTCLDNKLALHCDGARIYNRLVAERAAPQEYGRHFDSISICLSKGLGAPVGSVLIGNTDFIAKARRIRKLFGGGMRQAGILAAAGHYALDNNVKRMATDHSNAQLIGDALSKAAKVREVTPVDTNIVIFELHAGEDANKHIVQLAAEGILAFAMTKRSIRFVLHLDISEEEVNKVMECCAKIFS